MNNIKENNREEKLSQHKFVGNLYDFSNISFTDEIDSKNFKSIVQETVNRCFNDNIHLAYMDEISAYITILKYFSNFPVEEFTDDELYMICLYSNLRECIDKTKITNPDNKLFFIIQTLIEIIFDEKKRIENHSKLDEVIDYLIQFVDENSDDIMDIIQQNSKNIPMEKLVNNEQI